MVVLFQGLPTMLKSQSNTCLVTVILVVFFQNVLCDSNTQPRITSHEGDLIFQAAQDKNITIRLSGSSSFLVNDINVVNALQRFSIPKSPINAADLASLPDQVQGLKSDVRRLTIRLRRFENGTSSTSNGRIRRIQSRVRALVRRVNEMETKLREDDCSPNPCKNGGTCYDLYENFHCECPDTWTGKTCESDVDECYSLTGTDLGCQNNAACVNLPGGYRCVCTNGFTGIHCRERGTDCTKSRPGELCGHGACVPSNNVLGYQCICDAGWKTNNVSESCTIDVNECVESIVACHTSCINLPGSFMCGPCPNGYTGNGVTCRDIDECATNNGGCSMEPKVQCINTEGSHRCGNCPPGWTGNGRYCSQAETNLCADNNICHPLARCEYISNNMVCTCPTGMMGSGYGPGGCRAGSSNPCNEHQCQNGGTCINHGSTYSCICPTGFDPPFCQSQNPCSSQPCLNGGTCVKEANSNDFRCTCPRGSSGRFCQIKRNTCGSVIRDRTGELKHPPEGGPYRANEACAWVIRTDDNLILNVTFTQFDLQADPECSKDWLQINDGRSLATPLIGRYCGNQLPRDGNLLSSQNTLFLWFRTDNTTNLDGFGLNWNSVPPICGGRQVVDAQGHGVIKSPGYPGKSPPNRDCEWIIEAPIGKRVELRFFEVIMERSANCTKDSLIVYDTNEILDHICETGVPAPMFTSSNIAKVHFHTDPYREDSRFQAHFEVVEGKPGCGGLFTEPEGKFTFTLDLKGCTYLIQQPVGIRISIGFSKGDISFGLSSIKIFDGKTEDDPILFQSYDESLPENVTSTGNYMLVNIGVRNSFALKSQVTLYEVSYKQVCGQEFRDLQGGTFMTPNYPKPYYGSLNCEYVIVGPIDSVVHLNITDYDVSEYTELCDDDSDFVEFYYKPGEATERHCKGVPMHLVSPSNYMRIRFSSNTNPQQRRGISATYRFEEMGCGGVLKELQGSLELENPVSPTHAYCEWILEAPENHVISLDLTYRRTGRKCAPGEADLTIYLNETLYKNRLVESHCGGEKHLLTVLPTNLATVFLKLVTPALGRDVAYGIVGNYTFIKRSGSCGGNYTLLAGSIQSPGWPNEYPDLLDCIWIIHAPLGHKIELVPRNFSLEPNVRSCDDYLEIRNGLSSDSPLIGKFCGETIPPHIPSFTNHLYLRFHSDASLAYPGFDIEYRQTSTGCGGSLSSHSGSIASPHYPELSRGPVQCDWKITVSQGSLIDVSIRTLGPRTDFCSSNVLSIYDGDDSSAQSLLTNCSSSSPLLRISSSKNTIFVRYALPDLGAVDDEQFYLSYRTNCRQTIDAVAGVIESPNFPDDYPNMLRCEWNIVGRKAETISLTFSHFEIETFDGSCAYDYLELIDMKGEDILQTHKYCSNPEKIFTSDGNRLVVKFATDFSYVAKGFRLEFKRNGCGGHKTRSSGLIISPNSPYSVDVDCEWLIETSPGKQVVLDMFDVHIESGKDDCSTDGLIIRNNKDDTRDLLKECKVSQMPMTVTSHGSSMYVWFYSDPTRERKYFKASYRSRDAQCGGIFRGNKGELVSPNYPKNYSENTYCEWMVSVESSSTIAFYFENFDIPYAANCSKGYVEVYDGIRSDKDSRKLGRFCSTTRQPFQTEKNRINVIFSSENGPPAKGFLMKYKKTCGGVMNEEYGLMKSYEQDNFCAWKIRAKDEGAKITVSFLRIDCHCDGLDEKDCLKTRGVKITYENNPLAIKSFCEHHPPDFVSDGPSLVVTSANVTFIAKYSTIESACGSTLTSLRGTFTSPYYPTTYPSNIECTWAIQAPSGNYLQLNFVDMNIPKSDHCNDDYVEVREKTSNGKLLGIFCSDTVPMDTIQVFQQFWIKFRSSENGVGKGFKISWTNAQLNEITGFNGQIQPPSIISVRSESDPFKWRIIVPRDNVIQLAFREYNRGLQLYDGFDNTALPIEIQLSPWEVTSSTNVIFLISDNQLLDHFRIEWKAMSKANISRNEVVQECNETLVISDGPLVTLSSPGYPGGYEEDLSCQWLIKTENPSRHAVIEIYDARLEKMDGCPVDYLQISSSKNLINWHEELKVCDSPPKTRDPFAVIHGTPYLKVNLITDSSVNGTGFSAMAYTACGGNLTGTIGRILDVHVHNSSEEIVRNCTWHIEVHPGRKIKFDFRFPLNDAKESADQCENYALIRDGIDEDAPILPPGRICSYKQFNGTVFTTSNYATVKYNLKPHNPFLPYDMPMWNLTYREYNECGGEVRLTSYSRSVNITSPNYPNVPNAHTECIWIIVAPPGEAIQAEFVDHFDMNIRQCFSEFIEFRDGSTELARQLGKYCVRPGTQRSSGNVLYMRYLTDITEPRNGFKVNVSLSTCGGTFTQFSNIITSSNYPAPGGYPANSVCDYIVKVSSYARANLTFLDVHLPFDAANLNGSDRIEIYQVIQGDQTQIGDQLAVIYGNTTDMPAVEVDSNEVLIRFTSFKANNKYRGFKLKYDRIFGVCFKDVSGESGVLTLSIAPKRLAMFLLCRWKITVPKGRRVTLDVLDSVYVPNLIPVTRNFKVTFFNDFQMQSMITLVDFNSNSTGNVSVQSTDNKMFIRIFGAYTTNLRRMQVAYSSAEISDCPDDITTDSGSLSLSRIDRTNNFYCSSDFILTGVQTLAFNISRLILESIPQFMPIPGIAVRFKSNNLVESLSNLKENMTNEILAISVIHGSVIMLRNDFTKLKQFDATYTKHACGGEFSVGHQFDISLPLLRANYGTLDCAWHLRIPTVGSGYDLTANFSFNLPCENEYVTVHGGASTKSLTVAKLCRGVTLNTTRLRSQYVYVNYHTSAYNTNSKLALSLTRAINCGEKMNIDRTEVLRFTSRDYKTNIECVWDLSTQLGFYLQLEFMERYFIEESPNCTKDYLEIRKFEDGDWVALPRYCGRNLPSAVNTTSRRLQLIFRSDESITADGFVVAVKKSCYAVFNVTDQPQLIIYPTRWSLVMIRMQCDYILQTDSDKYILVKFNKLALGPRSRCYLAQLSAQRRDDSGNLVELGPYCKNNAVTEIRARKFLTLSYQALMETEGYEIEFALDNCHKQITRPTWIQNLKDEDGDAYVNKMDCQWNITAPEGHTIFIRFKYFIMEETEECNLDFLAIYRGSQMELSQREALICGDLSKNVPSFHIEGNSAIVKAATDGSVVKEGFMAEILFSKACDERITLTQANTPVDIERNLEVGNDEVMICKYHFMGEPGFRVAIELITIDLNLSNATCKDNCGDCDSLEVIDSIEGGSFALGKHCSSNDTSTKLISSYKDVMIRVNAERRGHHKFKVTIKLVEADCGNQEEYILDDSGGIQFGSMKRPNGLYPSNMHCTWKITSDKDFDIKFDHFSLQNKSDVTGQCLDYVNVKYTSPYPPWVYDQHCGSVSSFTISVSKNYMKAVVEITFHTNEVIESTGFTLTATNRAACNRTYDQISGLIGGQYEASGCINDILLPENYTVNIIIPSFYFEFQPNCSEKNVKIFDKKTNRVIFEDCAMRYQPVDFFSTTNQVRLETHPGSELDGTTNILYFGSPKSLPKGCGGNFELPRGIVHSPNYQEYGNASVCRWNFTTTAPNRIQLQFDEMNMGSVCKLDYLDIIEIADNGVERVAKHYCEADVPEVYVSINNRIAIKTVTSVGFDGTRWVATFSHVTSYSRISNTN